MDKLNPQDVSVLAVVASMARDGSAKPPKVLLGNLKSQAASRIARLLVGEDVPAAKPEERQAAEALRSGATLR